MQSTLKATAARLNALAKEYAATNQTNLTNAIKHVAIEETLQLGFKVNAQHDYKTVLKSMRTGEIIEAWFEACEEGDAGFYPICSTTEEEIINPWQQNLATLGSQEGILNFIRHHAVEVTHNGVTLKFFNAMPHTVRLGLPVENGRGVHQIARLASSGYVAIPKISEHVDNTTVITTVKTIYDCNDDVFEAIVKAKMHHNIITLMTTDAAKGFHTAGYTPILIEFGVYHWDRFAVVC